MKQETITTESMNVRIGSLYQDRKRFSNFPPFQRDKVWGLHMKQVFIDTILRRLPINSCMLMEDVDENGAGLYQVIDGQQRLETIIEFRENGFPTMTNTAARSGLLVFEPIEPGCLFRQLSPQVQNRFVDYKIPFVTFPKEHEDLLEEIFLRTNTQEPLSVGEQLFIRNSRARTVAMALLKHSFWQTCYTGRTARKDNFQAVLQTILIETHGFPVHLGLSHRAPCPISRLILGDYDDDLSETLKNTIWKRLSDMEHVYMGTHIHNKRDIIPTYEACILLDTRGFDLLASKEGCLAEWFVLAKRGAPIEKIRGYRPFGRIEFQAFQKAFWEDEAEVIQQLPGLARRSS